MMLAALRDVAVAAHWAGSAGFADKTTHFLLILDDDGKPTVDSRGQFTCWFPLTTAKGKKGIQSLGQSVPDRPETLRRNQNYVDADCFSGRADRLVFGGPDGSPAARCRSMTREFAVEVSGEVPELEPVRKFYELIDRDPSIVVALREAMVKALAPFQPRPRPGKPSKLKAPEQQEISLCTDASDHRPVYELPEVRRVWSRRQAPSVPSGDGGATCLCCGCSCEPVLIHKRVVKGLPGKGSKGVPVLSFNKESSQSHGLEDCANAPMCGACVDAYTIALNNLIRNKPPKGGGPSYGGCDTIAGLAFVYWLRTPDVYRPVERIRNGVQHVERRLESMATGASGSLNARANRFHMAVMSAPTLGRAVVHSWVDESLADIDRNLEGWFESTSLASRKASDRPNGLRFAEPGKGVTGSLWAQIMDCHIPSALGREIKDRNKIRERGIRWDIQKDMILAIFQRALLGRGVPLSVMHAALERLHEGIHDAKEKERSALPGFTTARLGLMRATLNDHPELLWKGRAIMPGLDRDRGDPAYVCGRMLAILSRIQAKAMAGRDASGEKERKLSANVVSRYYGAASSRPATGLYLPLRMRVHHLSKLDRDDPDEARWRRIDLQETMKWVDPDSLPRVLSPAQQCVFALGFEHQMAEFYKKRKTTDDTDTTLDNQTAQPIEGSN